VRRSRNGYALMLVLVTVALALSFYSLAHRQVAAALRAETLSVSLEHRDEGGLHALAQAITLLETGDPPSTPYVCKTTITTTSGPREYAVTYTNVTGTEWTVDIVPMPVSPDPPAMPDVF